MCKENSLANKFPHLLAEWDYEKNGDLSPEEISYGSGKRVWWICPYKKREHSYDMTPKQRASQGTNCPFCASKRVCVENCLATKFPELSNEWHPTKNGEFTPFNTLPGSHTAIWWICPDKGHIYDVSPNKRINHENCPYCANKRACEDNCLATKYPELAKEWHPTKNGVLTPFNTLPASTKVRWWICPEKGHEYDMTPAQRSCSGQNCPYCSNKRACEDNCLATKNPELAKEWHPTKNGVLTPFNTLPASRKIIWWICPDKGHEYDMILNKRSSSGTNCPYCANMRVFEGNCLQTTHPELAIEWHPIKNGNRTPFEIVGGNNKKAWWICRKGHEWDATPSQRTTKGTGCPTCKRSKGEAKIEKYLTEKKIHFNMYYSIPECRNVNPLHFDFAVFTMEGEMITLIEFDGIQHFEPVEYFGGERSFKIRKKNDKIKTEYCIDNNINLIRIKYSEYDQIERILTMNLFRLGLLTEKDIQVAA